MAGSRERVDRCPGARRPWPADDGYLVRLRLVGGRVDSTALRSLAGVAETHGDGRIHLTSRANLQVRALPGTAGVLTPEVDEALRATGLVPSPSHELVRNILVSPQTGLAGGRVDLRGVAAELDRRVCADPRLSRLPGRFLFALDDGRGDVVERSADLSAVAVSASAAQVRLGDSWGPVVPVERVASDLTRWAVEFVRRRGTGASAPWHVTELPEPMAPTGPAHPGVPPAAAPLRYGRVPGGRHEPVSEAGLGRADVARLTDGHPYVVVTPWRGILLPERGSRHAAA